MLKVIITGKTSIGNSVIDDNIKNIFITIPTIYSYYKSDIQKSSICHHCWRFNRVLVLACLNFRLNSIRTYACINLFGIQAVEEFCLHSIWPYSLILTRCSVHLSLLRLSSRIVSGAYNTQISEAQVSNGRTISCCVRSCGLSFIFLTLLLKFYLNFTNFCTGLSRTWKLNCKHKHGSKIFEKMF